MAKRENDLGRDPIGKLLLRLAVPTVTAQLVNALYNIVDRIYIGHIPGEGDLALTGLGICSLIGMVFLLYFMFRCFSRNIAARTRENARYIALTAKPRAAWARFNTRWDQRKTTKFLKCPQCGQSLTVPKGKGTLKVTCPKCRNQFTTKS